MEGRICFASVDAEKDLNQESFQGVENIDRILSIFKKYEIPVTLFATGAALQKYSEKFREPGIFCEIACHGFSHRFWNTINRDERKKELEDFIFLYQNIFKKKPKGFRAPSHIIDPEGIKLLEESGFLYDSSTVPHYPPFKKYRGYKGRAPLLPYFPEGRNILEIPVRGQILGIPLAGAWIAKLPPLFYKILFFFHCPEFITLNIHSWDSLKNFENIIQILKNKRYQFLNGGQIYQNYR